ncbi:MAG TPA: carboxylesterase family protein [Nonomuraea sp.]|nr:carboxylesterase family protein [Nonomuraea sp.]
MPVVETGAGEVRGFLDRGVPNWRGIPYGRVVQRFRPALPAAPSGPIDATRWGVVSWQVPMGLTPERWSPLHPDAVKGEDCLNLNIWSARPGRPDPQPVLVWIHPGRHMVGGNMTTVDPWVLAAHHDVVVVTVNFRLGPWGWLHLGTIDADLADCVNLAVRDQVLALSWVRDNIAAFGGDPGNVTLFGLSTGGSDVATLAGVPAARGLFHRAAVYSGSAERPIGPGEAARAAERFVAAARPLADTPAALRTLPNVALRHVHRQALRAGEPRYEAMIDGDLLPRPPLESLRAGLATDLPLLVSVTSDEARILDVVAGPAVDRKYAAFADPDDGATHEERIAFLSRKLYHEPAERLLAAVHAAGGHCWAQVFDYHPTTSQLAGNPAVAGRAVHGADTAALFCDLATGDAVDRAVGVQVQRALVGLARTGRPPWPEYTAGDPRARWIAPDGSGGSRRDPLPRTPPRRRALVHQEFRASTAEEP